MALGGGEKGNVFTDSPQKVVYLEFTFIAFSDCLVRPWSDCCEQPSHSCSAQSPPSSCGFRVLVVVVDFTVFCHHADLEVFIQLSESIAP